MKPITFSLPGDPVPQPRVRVSTRGGFARAYVPGKHPVHTYRQAIAAAAVAAGATELGPRRCGEGGGTGCDERDNKICVHENEWVTDLGIAGVDRLVRGSEWDPERRLRG